MADIELVIKLDEDTYKARQRWVANPKKTIDKVDIAIANATPLPKGHGVLKDADAMINKLCTQEASEFFGSATCAEILDFINDEKPIIEAENEESEE